MKNMYGETTHWFEVLGPAENLDERETLDFIDDYSKPAAELQLAAAIRRGFYPKGSIVYRSIATDKSAERHGCTVSHYDVKKGA
ncbi:hypothetical protein AGMMS4952_11090 [Spirochaetia bacterium]|nr:hypothetical protein AGMMS4952_11090 [Spirochaetia bacterium]